MATYPLILTLLNNCAPWRILLSCFLWIISSSIGSFPSTNILQYFLLKKKQNKTPFISHRLSKNLWCYLYRKICQEFSKYIVHTGSLLIFIKATLLRHTFFITPQCPVIAKSLVNFSISSYLSTQEHPIVDHPLLFFGFYGIIFYLSCWLYFMSHRSDCLPKPHPSWIASFSNTL